MLVLNLFSQHLSIVHLCKFMALNRNLSELIKSFLHALKLLIFNLLFVTDFFLLRSKNVVEVLLKYVHLAFICSVKSVEVNFLFFSVSLNVFIRFIKNEFLLVVWILSSEWTWWQKIRSSKIGFFLRLGLNETFIFELFKPLSLKSGYQWRFSVSRLSC